MGGAPPGREGTAAPFSPSCTPVTTAREVRSRSCFKSWDPCFSFPLFCFFLLFLLFFWRLLRKEGKREDFNRFLFPSLDIFKYT